MLGNLAKNPDASVRQRVSDVDAGSFLTVHLFIVNFKSCFFPLKNKAAMLL